MNTGRTVFSQIMDFLPLREFRKCVKRYRGNYKVQKFSCIDQFLCMAFAQLTYRESLRDTEVCLRAMQTKLYHMGIRSRISKSTLADANENRDWRIYGDFAQVLIHISRRLYIEEKFGVELDQTVYALDSTTIPTFIRITEALVHDVNILDDIIPEAGAFYIMDRGYLDFGRLYIFHQCLAFFITRAKGNFQFRRLYSQPIDKSTGLKCDQTIVLTSFYPAKDYPEKLRRIHYFDKETEQNLVFLTNCFTLPAITIAQLYKCRWHVELFFKWIKQHLRIKAFFGTSENAVKTQVWIAISVYVLVAIIKKELNLDLNLYTIFIRESVYFTNTYGSWLQN